MVYLMAHLGLADGWLSPAVAEKHLIYRITNCYIFAQKLDCGPGIRIANRPEHPSGNLQPVQ
jgi:hypothetical protein